MQDLLKQSASEFKAKFIEDTVMTGVRLVERSDGKAILDWHTKQMEKAYNKGREDLKEEFNQRLLEEDLLEHFNDDEIGYICGILNII